MSIALVVLVLAAVSGVVMGLFSLSTGPRTLSVPERTEHWLVAWAGRHETIRSVVVRVDRRVIGGIGVLTMAVAIVLATATVGWVLDSVDSDRGFARWDDRVAEWGASSASSVSTQVLSLVTHAGSTIGLMLVMGALALFDRRRRGSWVSAEYLAVIGFGIVVINNALKVLVMRERPLVSHLVSASGFSFPSGHSSAAAACWAAIAFVSMGHVARSRRWMLFSASIALTVAVASSRALLGVHWLTDVIAGVIVGWTWFVLVTVVFGGRVIALGAAAIHIAATAPNNEALTASVSKGVR